MLNMRVVAWSLGLFMVVTYLVCIAYGLVAPEALHMSRALEIMFPGFRWLTPGGFLIGLGEAFVYGVYGGLVFAPIHNVVARRFDRGARA